MEESGLAGIGKFVMRHRQYLGCLRVRDKTLTLEQMHFADEVDPPKEAVPNRLPAVEKRELEMALDLIEGFAGKWDPKKYKDTYTEALRKVIKAKQAGKEVHRAPEVEEEEQLPDLFEALRESVRLQRGGKRTKRPAKRATAKRRLAKKRARAAA
jgi:DNA end-binding protein Ku